MGKICFKLFNHIWNNNSIIQLSKININSIRFKIPFIIVLIVLMIMSVTGTYFYLSMSEILTENANKEFSQGLQQISNNLESQLAGINSTLMFILANPQIREIIESDSSPSMDSSKVLQNKNKISQDSYTQIQKKIVIEQQLAYLIMYNYLWDARSIKTASIFISGNEYYSVSSDSARTSLTGESVKKIYGSISKNIESIQIFVPNTDDKIIYFSKNIRNLNSLEYEGTIILGIDAVALSKVYVNILQYPNSQAFLADEGGTVLLHTDKNTIGQNIFGSLHNFIGSSQFKEQTLGKEQYLIASKVIDMFGWTSIIIVPKKQVISKLSNSMDNYIQVIFYILLIFLFFGIFLSSKSIKPLRDLSKNIEHVKKGNYDAKMPLYKDAELLQLATVFNDMTDEIQYLIYDVYQKKILLKDSELKSLHSQINPHFLFNVLETVCWYAQSGRNEDIYNIVTSLGELLRASITSISREKITIGEELRYVEFYVSIQKYRFEDRLKFNLDIENKNIYSYYIPKLCLQPIVENAIIHGIEEKVGQGTLNIKIFTKDNTIIFEIIDDGIGFDVNTVNLGHQENLISEVSGRHTHIGLYNSDKRIKLLYGNEYGLTIESEINCGTKVIIRIPVDDGGI